MDGAGKLLAFAVFSSIFLGFLYGDFPGVVDPFGNADREAQAKLEGDASQWPGAVQATGACLLGAGAVGAIAFIPTFGLGTLAIAGLAAGGCTAAVGIFTAVSGENPFEAIPIVGEVAKFVGLLVSFIAWMVGMMLWGLADPKAPGWVVIPVSGGYTGAVGMYVARLVRGTA